MTYFITTPLKTFVSCIKAPESSKDGFSGSFCSSSFSTLPPKFLWRRSSSGGSLFTLVRWQRSPSWSSWWWRGSFLTSLLLFLSFFLDPWGDLDRDLCLLYFRSLDLDLDLILLQKEKPSSKKFQIFEFWEEFVLTTSAELLTARPIRAGNDENFSQIFRHLKTNFAFYSRNRCLFDEYFKL